MHEFEISLVFRTPSGVILPTAAFHDIAADAKERGIPYQRALAEQVQRQSFELELAAA